MHRLTVLVLTMLMASACGGTAGEGTTTPPPVSPSQSGGEVAVPDEPPWCLRHVELPADAEEIAALFTAMPGEIGGNAKELMTSDSRLHVSYEEAIEGTPSVMAVDLAPLEMNGLRYLEIVMQAGEEEVEPGGITGTIERSSMDPSTGLVWAIGTTIEVGSTPDSDVIAPSMMFAAPDGDWVFNVTARTDEMLAEIVGAFCDATS